MNFQEFKDKYQKKPVIEYPNNLREKGPLVSVRVISYNHANFVRQCLDSILAQKTTFDFEIVIAEDESSDGTREICIEYAQKYPDKIRLLLNSRENNIEIEGKPTGLFNSVYSNFCISSKYISLCETDDYWTDEYTLQKKVEFMERDKDCVLSYHRMTYYYENTQQYDRTLPKIAKETSIIPIDRFFDDVMPTLTIVYRNHLVEKYDDGMKNILCGDHILIGKLSEFGYACYFHDIKPAIYRLHSGGVHSTASKKLQFERPMTAKKYVLEYLSERNKPNHHIHHAIATSYIRQFYQSLRDDKIVCWQYMKAGYVSAKKGGQSVMSILFNLVINKLKSV
ncbi:MAG: glycosyltransferase [Cyclobacteriaceae bacterium]